MTNPAATITCPACGRVLTPNAGFEDRYPMHYITATYKNFNVRTGTMEFAKVRCRLAARRLTETQTFL